LNNFIRDELKNKGYIFLEKFRPDANTIGIASEIGDPMIPWVGGLVQRLVPRRISTPNTYSGIYGFGQFPFHTDLAHWSKPPRYLLLRCIKGYQDIPTLIIDGNDLIKEIGAAFLRRAIFQPRRPQGSEYKLLSLYESCEDGNFIRWDEIFLNPASKVGQTVNDKIRDFLPSRSPKTAALVSASDTLIIDNWRILHARSSIIHGCEDRDIERIYLRAIN
jgi:L-asparagine oxygenase